MFSLLKNRFGVPGLIAVAALVFAMIGGAYAASGDGGGKATASATKAKKGPRGPRGPRGPQGPAGPAGPAGAVGAAGAKGAAGATGATGAAGANGNTGAAGATGATGPAGAAGATGPEGPAGPEGSPWTAGGTLPSGETETGVYATPPIPAASTYVLPISFPIPLETPITVANRHFLGAGEGGTEECPGSFIEPKAAPGNLCVYASQEEEGSVVFSSIQRPGGFLFFEALEAEAKGAGSWAVTAP